MNASMKAYNGVPVPDGELIQAPNQANDGKFLVPDHPIIPFIEGDGTGPDIWRASQPVFDAAVTRAYGGRRAIRWYEVFAGGKAFERFGEWLPRDTVDALRQFRVAIKGPLTTPVGGGIRSLNVTLRIELDLYACVRPVKYYPGVPSPVKEPEAVDVVIYRENTEDVYAGIEFQQGTEAAERLIAILKDQFGKTVRPDSGIGIKPISITGSKRLVRQAIRHAIEQGRTVVTLVHKGNIQKFTEGAFRDWGYEVATQEFRQQCVTEAELAQAPYNGSLPTGKILVNDRIADSMFQQILLRPRDYQVICTTNLNGDYLSDACAAQVGGLGMAPGANLSQEYALFEATHGTAPKYAGKDVINPGSLILSGVMMLNALGWKEAATLVESGLAATIRQKRVTYDLARQLPGATQVKTSEFAQAIIANMDK
ncbi:MAG TPA: isocitrate dehydrogenase (NADP(+)) [Terriglobales bacterium]|nr:isocitrate dehydrogenase (NADP(+)) [Terriglobales bacterium]